MSGLEKAPKDEPIIDSVPGIDHSQLSAEPTLRSGEIVTIPEGQFRGDPSRVPGHPSNPFKGMEVDSLFPTPKPTEAAVEAGQVAVERLVAPNNTAMIEGVPPEIMNPRP